MVSWEHDALDLIWPVWISQKLISVISIELSKQSGFRGRTDDNLRKATDKTLSLTKQGKVAQLKNYLKEGQWIYKLFISEHKTKVGEHMLRAPILYESNVPICL